MGGGNRSREAEVAGMWGQEPESTGVHQKLERTGRHILSSDSQEEHSSANPLEAANFPNWKRINCDLQATMLMMLMAT